MRKGDSSKNRGSVLHRQAQRGKLVVPLATAMSRDSTKTSKPKYQRNMVAEVPLKKTRRPLVPPLSDPATDKTTLTPRRTHDAPRQAGQVPVAAPEHQMSGTGQQAEKRCDRHRALSFWQLYWLATPNKGGLKQLSEDNWIGFERKYYSGSGGSCQLGGAERLTGEERHSMIYIIECILWNRTGEEKKWSKMWNLST